MWLIDVEQVGPRRWRARANGTVGDEFDDEAEAIANVIEKIAAGKKQYPLKVKWRFAPAKKPPRPSKEDEEHTKLQTLKNKALRAKVKRILRRRHGKPPEQPPEDPGPEQPELPY